MNRDKSKELKVGIVTIVSIVLLLVGISLGKGLLLGINQQEIMLRFPNSAGLKDADPLVVNGVRRGSVKSVINDKDSVLVRCSIDHTNDLHANASGRITILEVTGGKKVELILGNSVNRFVPGTIIIGNTPPDLAELVTIVGEVSGDLTKIIRRLDTLTGTANNVLADGKLLKDLKLVAANAAELTGSINQFFNANQSDIHSSVRDLAIIASDLKNAIKKNEPGITSIIEKLDVTLTETRKIVARADTTVTGANTLIASLNDISYELRHGKGFAAKALFDKDFSARMDTTFANLNNLIQFISNNGVNVNVRLGTRP